MKLTDYFIRRKVKALAGKASDRKHCFRSLDDARHILVLYNVNDRGLVEPSLKLLRSQNKKVSECIYIPCGGAVADSNAQMQVNAKTDLDMWYMPSGAVCKKFNSLDADILIDLTRSTDFPMQYLLLNHPCSLKVGAGNRETDLYDLTISMINRDDIKHLFEQILFYLRTICSK